MAKKTKRDPTQSEWISNKYARDLQKAMKQYQAGMVDLMIDHADNLEQMREQLDEYKTAAITTIFRPLAEKYVTLATKQGGKFAQLQLKHVKT